MFIENVTKLCEKNGEKLTPLMKKLKLSPGNVQRWRDGATVNSDILLIFSEYFNVSVDYLLTGHEYISNEKEHNDADNVIINNKLDFSDPKEKELLEKYRLLPEDLQNKTLGYIDGMLAILPSANSESEKRLSS